MLKKTTGAVTLLLLLFSPAYAAHPLITDDTGTQGKGKFQIEINSGFSTNKECTNGISVQEREREIAAVLSCGITENIDLVVGMPLKWYSLKEEGISATEEQGIGDMTVDFKWRMLESEESGMSLALKPGLSVPTGSEEKGFGNGAISGGVALIATHEGRLGALHCNLAYRRNAYHIEEDKKAARNDIWHASLAGELNLTENLRSVLNVGIETGEKKAVETHPTFLLGGLIYSVSEKLDLDVGVKCGLNEAETDRAFLAGLATRF